MTFNLDTLLYIISVAVTIIGGGWSFLQIISKKFDVKIDNISKDFKEYVSNRLNSIEDKYVSKDMYNMEKEVVRELYEKDRQSFLGALTQIRTDIVTAVNHLTDRIDVLFNKESHE